MSDQDLGEAYKVERTAQIERDLLARNDERLRQLEAGNAAGETPGGTKPAADTPAQGGPAPGFRRVLRASMRRGEQPEYVDIPAGDQGSPMAIRAAKDLGKGMVEGPRQALGGISDAVHNTAMAFSAVGDWVNENLVDTRIPVPLTGIEQLDQLIADPLKAAAGQKNEVAPAESTTGSLIRETTRFLTGFLPASRTAAATGMGKIAGGAAAGGAAEAMTRDPSDHNLADLVKQFPALRTPITDFLGSNPDDPEALARFKKGLEGAGLGLLADGMVLGVKAVASRWRSGAKPEELNKLLAEQRAQYGEVKDRDFLILGDPRAPLFARQGGLEPEALGRDRAARKLTTAENTDLGVPSPVAARGLEGAAADEAKAATAQPKVPGYFKPQEVASLRAQLEGGATPEQLAQHPLLAKAYDDFLARQAKAATPEQIADPAFRAARKFKGGIVGYEAAAEKLMADAKAFAGPQGVVNERRATIVIGPAASGKSTLAERLAADRRAAIVDPDEAKKIMPEFAGGIGSGQVHEESSALAGDVLTRLIDEGANMILPKIGANARSIERLVDGLAREGYKVDLVYLKVDAETAYRRAVDRFLKTGRLIDKETLSNAPKIQKTYETLAQRGGLDGYAEIDQAARTVTGSGGIADRLQSGRYGDGLPPQGAFRTPKEEGLSPAGPAGDRGQFYINWARIDGPDDLKRIMQDMADAFAPAVEKARRGTQSNEETVRLAEALDMTPSELLRRRAGEAFNAEQAYAARELWAASAAKLLEVAKRAAEPNAGTIDQFNFRRMLAIHQAIQNEVLAARAEAGRALQAWSIPAGASVERAKAITEMMQTMGGPDLARKLAQRLAIAGEEQGTKGLRAFTEKTWRTASFEVVQEAWVNMLLSNPKTHIVNMTSNAAVAVNSVIERSIAERLASAWDGSIAPGEAAAMAYGLISSINDGFRMAGQALRTGQRPGMVGVKADSLREPAIKGDFLRESGYDGWAAAVDYIGKAARVPTTLLGVEDAFFRTLGYRAELYATSLRQATTEGLKGDALYRRMGEIVANPPESIRLAAADAALYNTFSNATGDWGKALLRLRESIPPIAFVLPFISTPINITRYAFERSPVAPLVGQWRADIAAGGARRDLAIARMATGTVVMAAAFDAAQSGLISGGGPDDAGEKANWLRQGWQPYSLRVGDRWVSYNRLDPLGMTLGFAADMAELVHRFDIEPEEVDEVNEVLAAGVAAVSNVVINKTYMQGMSNVFAAMHDSRTNSESAADYINKLAASFIPAAVGGVEQIVDPTQREVMSLGDAVLAKIPELSKRLMPKRDLWGKVIEPDPGLAPAASAVWSAISPVQMSRIKDSPIDAEMARLDLNINRISKRTTFDGVSVNLRDYPEVYDAYVRLAGNDLKHPAWNLGAKDLLDRIVTGKHELSQAYELLQDTRKPEEGGKAQFIAKQIAEFRSLARDAILADPKFSAFTDAIDGQKAVREEKRMPKIGASGQAPRIQ